ncbi:hypothetical protein C8R47DRAFT_1121165 [Mycena vitilis]|nr:hypothetical protein C8R47DRAFT_1121165 [Mycena vitilis]
MNIFSPQSHRSKRRVHWNVDPAPTWVWPPSQHSSQPTMAWNISTPPLSPPAWGSSPTSPWGNSWYPISPFSTPQASSRPSPWANSGFAPSTFGSAQLSWTTSPPSISLSPLQPFYRLPGTHPSYSQYQPTPNWDISTPPATGFDTHGLSAFSDLQAAVPARIEKIRIFVERPAIAYWTKQWGYATAHRRNGKAITLLDVLEAVYNYFQEPLPVDAVLPQYQGMLTSSYAQRVAKAGAGAADGGLTRVDVLNGTRVLMGMRPLSYGDAAGTMYIALCLGKA